MIIHTTDDIYRVKAICINSQNKLTILTLLL
ncbi:MAG: hypothetical protein H6Q19_1903 [Bacteroidetes bacterium]|nr:hypothetical protein [Bacteroidota bacterium]